MEEVNGELEEAVLNSEGREYSWIEKDIFVEAHNYGLVEVIICNKGQEDGTFVTTAFFLGKKLICVTGEEIDLS